MKKYFSSSHVYNREGKIAIMTIIFVNIITGHGEYSINITKTNIQVFHLAS